MNIDNPIDNKRLVRIKLSIQFIDLDMSFVQLVGGFNPSEKYESVGKDSPIYYVK